MHQTKTNGHGVESVDTTGLGLETEIDILLVEDTPSDMELAVYELHRLPCAHRIHVLDSGAEALDFIFCRGSYQSRSLLRLPKVILLDMQQPKVDGLQVLQALRGDARTRAIPVVIMTSSDEPRDWLESYHWGVNAFIRKPVNYSDFRQVIERIAMFWLTVNHAPPSDVFAT